jgi:PAS domain S-box-containing protein
MIETTESARTLQRKLELVVQTGLLLTKDLDLQIVIQAATDAGLELSGARFGAYFYNIVSSTGESYLFYALSGAMREQFADFPLSRDSAIFSAVFEDSGIIRSGDISKDPRYNHHAPFFAMSKGKLPVRSYLAVPVKSQSGEIFGGLFYCHEDANVFEQDAEDLVATVAAQTAIAMENVRLRAQLTYKIEDLEKAYEQQRETAKHLGELAAIVTSSDDAIISKDLNGIITSWNESATRIMGYTSEEMVGESILKLIPKELHPQEDRILSRIRSGTRIDHFETVRLTKSGQRLDVELTVSPIRDELGTIIGASKILRDISRRKRIEASLLQAEKIAATGRMAAAMAHEINNPLEAVVNLLFLARLKATDTEQIEYLATAESELGRVSHIARQALGFYREHASALSISLSDLAANAIAVYETKCRTAGIRIVRHLDSTQKIVLRRGEIMQVVSNLVVNAIYAMPDGGTLTLSTKDLSGEYSGVLLTVEDTGVGIPEEHLPRIFEAFYTTRSAIGTGIGLFIAKQFIEGHGGKIEVESSTDEKKHGTKMTLFLPLETRYERESDV